MVNFRKVLMAMAGALVVSPTHAQNWYPVVCCPNSCLSFDEIPQLTGHGIGQLHGSRGLAVQRLPFSKDLHVGTSPDAKTHVCVGYDSFGNKEIKCMFTPPMM